MELWILFGVFTLLMLIGTPIAFCLGVASFATAAYMGLPPLIVFQRLNSGMSIFSMLAKFLCLNMIVPMRSAIPTLMLLSAALLACANAQDGAAPKPVAKPGFIVKPPAANQPPEAEPKGARSELSSAASALVNVVVR